jgi:xanthine/uracil permease
MGRNFLSELAVGLGLAWWFLSLLELIKRGIVSLYINLNLLLLLTALAWLLGTSIKITPKRPYLSSIFSAVLVWLVSVKLILGTPFAWYLSILVGLVAGVLWWIVITLLKLDN